MIPNVLTTLLALTTLTHSAVALAIPASALSDPGRATFSVEVILEYTHAECLMVNTKLSTSTTTPSASSLPSNLDELPVSIASSELSNDLLVMQDDSELSLSLSDDPTSSPSSPSLTVITSDNDETDIVVPTGSFDVEEKTSVGAGVDAELVRRIEESRWIQMQRMRSELTARREREREREVQVKSWERIRRRALGWK